MAVSTIQPTAADASFVGEVQNFISIPNQLQGGNLVKNQLFNYTNPYPNHLPPLDSDKYDPMRMESSDVLSPKLPQRKLPLLSDGHRQSSQVKHASAIAPGQWPSAGGPNQQLVR